MEIISDILLMLCLTLLIEVPLILIMSWTRGYKNLGYIALCSIVINFITNLFLNIMLVYADRFGYSFYLMLLFVLEIFVFVGESLFYVFTAFKDVDNKWLVSFMFSLVSNVVSFSFGMVF